MRKISSYILLLFCFSQAHAQIESTDSLKYLSVSGDNDSIKFMALTQLSNAYVFSHPDSAILYSQKEILIAGKMKSPKFLSIAYSDYCMHFISTGDYPQALYYSQLSVTEAEKTGNELIIACAYNALSAVNWDMEDYKAALEMNMRAKSLLESKWTPSVKPLNEHRSTSMKDILKLVAKLDTASIYLGIIKSIGDILNEGFNLPDSGLYYINLSGAAFKNRFGRLTWPDLMSSYGSIYLKKKDYKKAIQSYHQGVVLAIEENLNVDLMNCYNGLASTFKQMNQSDSGIYYAKKVLEISRQSKYPISRLNALNVLTDLYHTENKTDSVAKYLQLTIEAKDSLFSRQKVIQMQGMIFGEQLRQQQIIQDEQLWWNAIKLYSLLAAAGVFSIIALLLYRNNRHKQKAFSLLRIQKQETDLEKEKTEKAYNQLKSAQAQLIQSEKMASLGELTAGIAHEIQNPLNFVNNFSDVNAELIEEAGIEMKKGNISEAELILKDIRENEKKINHHGKRADSIVKGMLQHSRSSTGQKEPTDINALANEYLRLSYHGIRGKDKSFNATIQTDFDNSIGKINIIPQDIGRVLLNLYNNAFYVVNEKKKTADDAYEPTVSVRTKKEGDKVIISIKDNGNGIPQNIVDKIFQPFFTTKPTGQGTGLGLSLSYDIVKAHGGELKVETKDGEYAEFIIIL